ncbi:MAG TPA: inositol monophosphatase family protein [Candidatus Nanoarchaeia archaeon]|nr:inositol monophosphatase family protein [Candidatus Nanoarchaeia archaeon]
MVERLEFALRVTEKANKILMGRWRSGLEAKLKADNSVVTDADLEVSAFVQDEIQRAYPNDGILNEEVPDTRERLEKIGLWIVDPLDGSRRFQLGEVDFCFLLSYVENGVPRLGIISEPATGRMMYAAGGQGAHYFRYGLEIKLRELRPVPRNKMKAGHPPYYNRRKYDQIYDSLGIGIEGFKRSGCMGSRMLDVATGEAHLIVGWTKTLGEWDVAAGHVICEERGLSVTDIFGGQLRYNQPEPRTHSGILVVHESLKRETLDTLAQFYGSIRI